MWQRELVTGLSVHGTYPAVTEIWERCSCHCAFIGGQPTSERSESSETRKACVKQFCGASKSFNHEPLKRLGRLKCARYARSLLQSLGSTSRWTIGMSRTYMNSTRRSTKRKASISHSTAGTSPMSGYGLYVCEATPFRYPITAWSLHNQSSGHVLRLPELSWHGVRASCVSPRMTIKHWNTTEDMIQTPGEKGGSRCTAALRCPIRRLKRIGWNPIRQHFSDKDSM